MARVSIVEALVIFLISIIVMLVLEVTLGAVFDQMAYTFAQVYVPGMKQDIIYNILSLFKQIHLIVGITLVMTAVWVVRVLVFEHEYDRGL
jgi:hypothetical protein